MASNENITEQLRRMAKTPFEGLQAAVLSDVVENQQAHTEALTEMISKMDTFIVSQEKTNDSNQAGISENKSAIKENSKAITEIKIKDVKAIAVIGFVSTVFTSIVGVLVAWITGVI